MSSYSVSDNQIHVMVSYIVKNMSNRSGTFYIPPFNPIECGPTHDPNMLNIQAIWDCLRKANDTSFNNRYQDEGFTDPVPFICALHLPEPLAMIRIVQNFEYQACEYKAWYTSKAKSICDGIVNLAITNLMKGKEYPWGFDDDIEPDPYFCAPKLSSVDKPEPGKAYRLI